MIIKSRLNIFLIVLALYIDGGKSTEMYMRLKTAMTV